MSQKHYKAFISYSHEDEAFGLWLHKELEKYKIPKKLREDHPNLPKTLYPIFRDRYELNAGDDLGVEIPKALENSDALIVVCSTKSADSKWVNKEIIDFKIMYGEDRIFPIILDGEPFARESDKFDNELECFPEALKYKVDSEGNLTDEQTSILASSAIEKEDGRELAKLKLIAGVLGVPFGMFHRRDIQYKKEELEKIKKQRDEVEKLKNIAVKNEEKMKQELYNNMVQRGIQERDFFNNPLKAKLFFSKAISISSNMNEEQNSKILYESMNKVELKNIFEYNKSKYGCWGANFSENEKQILSWSGNYIKLWDKNSNKLIVDIEHNDSVQGGTFNKNNRKILSWSDDKTVRLWDINQDKECLILKTPYIVYVARFTKDEKRILCWGNNESLDKSFLYLWDIENKKIVFEKRENIPVNNVVLNYDDKQILYWGGKSTFDTEEGFLKIIDIESQRRTLLSLEFENSVHGVSYSKNQNKLLIWTEYSIIIWDLNNKKYLFNSKGNDWILNAKFNNDEDKILVLYGRPSNWEKNAKLWSVSNSKEPLFTWEHDFTFIHNAIFNKDNTKVLTCGDDGNVKLWSTEDGTLLKQIEHKDKVAGANFFDNENKILSWTGVNTNIENNNKGSIYLWANDYFENKPYFILEHDGIINDVKVSKDKKELLSYSSDNTVRLWNIQLFENEKSIDYKTLQTNVTREPIAIDNLEIEYDNEDIENIVFDKSKRRLLFSLYTGKIILLDVESKKEICNFSHSDMDRVIGVSFSKDESKIFSWGEDATIKLWDIREKKLLKTFHDEISIKGIILSKKDSNIFYSWSGTTSNIPSGKGTVRIWNMEEEIPLLILRKEISGESGISGIALNQDETQLISWVGGGFNLDLWDMNDGTKLLKLNLDSDVEDAKFLNNREILIIKDEYSENNEPIIIELYKNKKLKKEYYPLEVEVESGCSLTKSGEIKVLTKEEWLQKKKKYEQIIKDSK